MLDITTIPEAELKKDLTASLEDIRVCKLALSHGVTKYSGGEVRLRLTANEGFVKRITAELQRRQA